MHREYRIDKKSIMVPLIIFLIISMSINFFCLYNILENKKAIAEFNYDEKEYSLPPEMAELLEKNMKEGLEKNYSVSILICVLASLGEAYFFVTYFLLNTKIIISEKGISIYHIYKKKAVKHYNWDQIKSLNFGYGKCDKGLLGQYVVEIKLIKNKDECRRDYIPIQKLKNYDHMFDELKNLYPHMSINKIWHMSEEKRSLKETIINAYGEYKKRISEYMLYSFIIFVFGLLTRYIQASPVNIFAFIASIYFGFRAKIGMNYMAYKSYEGNPIGFEEGWEYGKDRLEKYFEANVVMFLIFICFVIGESIIITSSLSKELKLVGSTIIGILLLMTMVRIYLMTYVVVVIGKKESYISIANEILKNNYGKVLVILGILSIGFIPAMIYTVKSWPNMYEIKAFQDVFNYTYVFINLFISPILSCIMMKIIADSYMGIGGKSNE